MSRILLLIFWQFSLLGGGGLFADVVTLNDGRQISGLVESGNIQELHIKVADRSDTIDIHQVQAIQFGVSLPAPPVAPPPPKTADVAPTAHEPAPAQPNSLILNDGTHVPGRWWSIDTTTMHFVVNNQLQDYPRPDVSVVTFGNATLPPPPSRSTSSATSAQPLGSVAQPARAPTLAPSSAGAPPQAATLTRPSGSVPPPVSPRGLSQPEEIGMVYSWNGRVVIPLERNQAMEHRSGPTQYWEMPGPQSHVRLNEASSLVFVVGLPTGVDPASYSLFPLETVNGGRRTRSQRGRRGGLVTWPVDIVKKDESSISIITYILTVRDLPIGEYSFSPSNSNDGYCFGVDPSAPGK